MNNAFYGNIIIIIEIKQYFNLNINRDKKANRLFYDDRAIVAFRAVKFSPITIILNNDDEPKENL